MFMNSFALLFRCQWISKKSMSLFLFLWLQRTESKANLADFLKAQAVNCEMFVIKMHLFFVTLDIVVFLFSVINMLVFYAQSDD